MEATENLLPETEQNGIVTILNELMNWRGTSKKKRPLRPATCKRGSKTGKLPTETVPPFQNAIMNGIELTATMKLAIEREKKRRLIELLDAKLFNGLGLPPKKEISEIKIQEIEMPGKPKKNKSKIGNGKKTLECSICHKTFRKIQYLSKHKRNAHPDETETKNGQLQECVDEATVPSVPKCRQCGHISTDANSLKNHELLHSIKEFICDICGDSFDFRRNLTTHRVFHLDNRPFQCQQCDARFKCKAGLKRHISTHSSERPHVCSVCGKDFTMRAGLRNHMKNLHGINPSQKKAVKVPDKPHACHCGTVFSEHINLRCHMKNVHGTAQEDLPAAPQTNMSKNPHQGKDHIKTCRKRHLCSFCGRFFSGRQLLLDHQAEHTGEMHLCPHCGFLCKLLPTMKFHIKRHFPDEKKYVCEICGSSFYQKCDRIKHQKIHSENSEKPHACNLCKASFKSRRGLTFHRKRMHSTISTNQQGVLGVGEMSLEEPTAQSMLTSVEEIPAVVVDLITPVTEHYIIDIPSEINITLD